MTRLTAAATPRGIRNNNPLNVRINAANDWNERVPLSENTDGEFEQAKTMVEGVRWGAVLIQNHYQRRGDDTIFKLVSRWAPPSENKTEAYARYVAERAGFGADETVDFRRWEVTRPVIEAMIRFENKGESVPDAVIEAGLIAAGIRPPDRSLTATRTVKGGQVAATGTAGTAVVTTLADQAKEAVEPAAGLLVKLGPYLGPAKWVFIGLIVAGLAYMLYARWDDRRKGLR